MITEINDKITIWRKFDLAKLSMDKTSPPNILFNEEQISINEIVYPIKVIQRYRLKAL